VKRQWLSGKKIIAVLIWLMGIVQLASDETDLWTKIIIILIWSLAVLGVLYDRDEGVMP